MPVRDEIAATDGVERAEDELRLELIADQPGDTLAHLPTGLDGEGAANDVLGPEAMVRQEVGDARRQRLGLAGSGGSEDLEDRGRGGDGRPLSRIQPIENGVH